MINKQKHQITIFKNQINSNCIIIKFQTIHRISAIWNFDIEFCDLIVV